MNEAQAHDFFIRKHDQGDTDFFPHTVELCLPATGDDPEAWQDIWTSGCVAAVLMVGWLDDCQSDQDLLDAIAHFETCVSSGIGGFTLEDWKTESQEVAIRCMERMRTAQGAN